MTPLAKSTIPEYCSTLVHVYVLEYSSTYPEYRCTLLLSLLSSSINFCHHVPWYCTLHILQYSSTKKIVLEYVPVYSSRWKSQSVICSYLGITKRCLCPPGQQKSMSSWPPRTYVDSSPSASHGVIAILHLQLRSRSPANKLIINYYFN